MDRADIGGLTVAAAVTGLLTWPIAVCGHFAAIDILESKWLDAISPIGFGILATITLIIFPKAASYFYKKGVALLGPLVLRILIVLAITALSLIFLFGFDGFSILYALSLIMMFATIPAFLSGGIFGGIVLLVLQALKARSLLAFGFGGALGGIVPIILTLIWTALEGEPRDGYVELIVGSLAFWCVGGMVTMMVVWSWWQFQLERAAKVALAHQPIDPPVLLPLP